MRMIPLSVPKVKTVEVENPKLGSLWLTKDIGVGDRGNGVYCLKFQGFLYCLVDFEILLVTPECGDPQS